MAQRLPDETLQDLLIRLMGEADMSGRQFEAAAREAGYDISYGPINAARRGEAQKVSDKTIQAIAAVFNVPVGQVYAAAEQAMPDTSTDPQLLALHNELTPDEKKEALKMYRAQVAALKRLRPKA